MEENTVNFEFGKDDVNEDAIRIIKYTKGQAYRVVYNEEIEKNDIFYNEYMKAFRLLNNIAVSNYHASENKERYIEEAKNIIGFCGERGQGKTTAMIRFKNMLENLNKKKDISKNIIDDLKESYKNEYKLDHEKFYCLDIIDPSKFEDFSSILDIVVLKIYNDIKKDMSNERCNNDYEDLRKALDSAYKSICLFKNPKECMSKQYDLDFGITKLSVISENMKVRENISTLVDEYLKFKSNSTSAANKYLVISIDDLDLDTKRSYEISEEIRKYLDCDNIIVIMAVRSKQLLYSVEREFLDDYKIMLNEKVIDEGEIHKMAYKYVDKLLPERNRIYLPKLNSKFDIAKLKIKYVENSKDIKDDDVKNMESFILNMIYEKTGMIFYQKGEVHILIPDTLRELISLLSFLTELENFNEDMNVRNDNLELFEEYFFNHWVNDNLNNNENEILMKIRNSNDEEFNYNILYDVFKQDENDEVKNDESIYNKSIGDVYKKLINTNNIIDDKIYNKNKFISALKILITIRMNKIDCGCRIKSSKDYYVDSIKNIVGTKLFTNEIDIKNLSTDSINKKVMSYNGKINESRYYFKMDYKNFSKYNDVINEFDKMFIKVATRKNIFNIIESEKNKLMDEINYNEYEIMNLDNIILFCFYKDYYKDLLSDFEISQEKEYHNLCKYIKKMILNADVVFELLNDRTNKADDLSSLVKNIKNKVVNVFEKSNFDNSEDDKNEEYSNMFSFYNDLLEYQIFFDEEKNQYARYSMFEDLNNHLDKFGYVSRQKIKNTKDKKLMIKQLYKQIIYILNNYKDELSSDDLKLFEDDYNDLREYNDNFNKKIYTDSNRLVKINTNLDNFLNGIGFNFPDDYIEFKETCDLLGKNEIKIVKNCNDLKKKIAYLINLNDENIQRGSRGDRITSEVNKIFEELYYEIEQENDDYIYENSILDKIEIFIKDIKVGSKDDFEKFILNYPFEFMPYCSKLYKSSVKTEYFNRIAYLQYMLCILKHPEDMKIDINKIDYEDVLENEIKKLYNRVRDDFADNDKTRKKIEDLIERVKSMKTQRTETKNAGKLLNSTRMQLTALENMIKSVKPIELKGTAWENMIKSVKPIELKGTAWENMIKPVKPIELNETVFEKSKEENKNNDEDPVK